MKSTTFTVEFPKPKGWIPNKKERKKFILVSVMARFVVFGLIGCGIYHLYTTIFDTDWPLWLDATMAFIAALNVFGNDGLRKWFLNKE